MMSFVGRRPPHRPPWPTCLRSPPPPSRRRSCYAELDYYEWRCLPRSRWSKRTSTSHHKKQHVSSLPPVRGRTCFDTSSLPSRAGKSDHRGSPPPSPPPPRLSLILKGLFLRWLGADCWKRTIPAIFVSRPSFFRPQSPPPATVKAACNGHRPIGATGRILRLSLAVYKTLGVLGLEC